MKPLNIAMQSINSLSLLISLFILILLIKKRLYRNTLTEFIIYILISEIINSTTKYLSFLRNSCFNINPYNITCLHISLIGNIQIYLDIFANVLAIVSCFIIAWKINDTFKNNSLFFNKYKNIVLSRLLLFFTALITSVSIGTIQIVYYQKYHNDDWITLIEEGKCYPINCFLATNLNCCLVGILIGFLVNILIINVINCRFLVQQSNRLINNDQTLCDKVAMNRITIMKWRIMTFPICSMILYCFFYSDKAFDIIFDHSTIEYNGNIQEIAAIIYGFSESLRGIIFAIIIIWTLPDLQEVIKQFFCGRNLNESLITEQF